MLSKTCKYKTNLPKISKLTTYILHLFFNAPKNQKCFEFGYFHCQPEWFIQLWNTADNTLKNIQMKKAEQKQKGNKNG